MKKHILLGQLASQAWAMHPDHLANLSSVLHRWSVGEAASPDVMAEVHAAQAARAARKATPTNAAGNIAVLNLWGVMSQKANMVDEASGGGGTSTQAFTAAFKDAMSDTSVAAILIDLDSPGGSVSGTPELAAEVLKARGVKPVYGFVNGLAASACYWVASACEAIYSTQSGSAGSIGVYTAHTDASEAMKKAGLAQEFISAGKYKVEGSSNGPLSAEARAFTQSQIDTYYNVFTNDVARGRGVAAAAVRNGFGQGRCLLADDALRAGLIDGICSFEQVVAKLSARVKGGTSSPGGQSAAVSPIAARASFRAREIAMIETGSAPRSETENVAARAAARKRQLEIASLS
jgi:signal peptide peptidase SppA